MERSPPLPDRPASPAIVAVSAGALWLKKRHAHPSNYGRRVRPRTQFITLHCTDGHEGPQKDGDVAAMFAGILAKPRSCTYVVDTDSVTECVPPNLTAWHCGHTGNARSEGIELCGRANQTREQWFDALSLPMLNIAARLVAERCKVHSIPIRFVDSELLREGLRGITTHAEVSRAWGESRHTDPGPNFPMQEFIAAALAANAPS